MSTGRRVSRRRHAGRNPPDPAAALRKHRASLTTATKDLLTAGVPLDTILWVILDHRVEATTHNRFINFFYRQDPTSGAEMELMLRGAEHHRPRRANEVLCYMHSAGISSVGWTTFDGASASPDTDGSTREPTS